MKLLARSIHVRWFLAAAGFAYPACASTEDELYSTPYRMTPPELNVDDASVGTGGGGGQVEPPVMDDAGVVPLPPVTDSCAASCPQTFGQACCNPAGQCGFDIGFGCIVIPLDAGAGAGGAGGGGGIQPPPMVEVECRSDGECDGSGQCCAIRGDNGYTSVECRNSCEGNVTPIACNGPSACGDGERCCGHTETAGGSLAYVAIECAEACDGENDYALCATDDDCSEQTQCLESTLLPEGFRVCR